MMTALNHIRQRPNHIVTQVVETKFIVSTVSNIRPVSLLAGDGEQGSQPVVPMSGVGIFRIIDKRLFVNNDAYRQAQQIKSGAVPTGVAAGQIIVDGNQVSAFTG